MPNLQANKTYLLEQTSRLKEQAAGALVATLVVVAYVAYSISDKVDSFSLYAWIGIVVAINVYLVIWIVAIHKYEITTDNVNRFVYSYQFEAVLHGLSWGYLPFMLAQTGDVNAELFSYYVICSMGVGAIATTGMIYKIYLSYMLPMMLPVVIDQLLFEDTTIFSGSTLGLLIIFIIAMLMLSYRHYGSVRKSIMFSHRNEELLENLRQEYLRAEEASHAKSRFLANMSHELRTPLNAVIGYSEIIEEEASESGSERISTDAEKIRISGKHLLRLIDDVLNLSRLEAGKVVLNLETFNVEDMLGGINPLLLESVNTNQNCFVVDIDDGITEIVSDIRLIEKILISLVSNAGKFTRDGKIRLHVYQLLENDAPRICFALEDTGIGMDEKQQQILFDAFRQADESSTRKYGGMGLGMAITQKFVELLNGTIRVESEQNKGSRITVCLPTGAAAVAHHDSIAVNS